MIVYLAIYSPGKYYEFMKELQTAQMKVYGHVMYFVRRVSNPQDFSTPDSISYKSMVIRDHVIYTQGQDDIYIGCVLKTLEAIDYILHTHKDLTWLVRTNSGTYFNVLNVQREFADIPQDVPVLYGFHQGGMAYGSYMVWNKKACIDLCAKATSTETILKNYVDDLAFTKISVELGFAAYARKKDSKNIYDSIWEYTGIRHYDVQPDWIFYKQKTYVDEYRDTSDIYRYTEFVKKYDPKVYALLVETEPQNTHKCLLRECEFMYNVGKMQHIDYTMSLCMKYLDSYSQDELYKLLIIVLAAYSENIQCGLIYCEAIKKHLLESPIQIKAEIIDYSFRGKYTNKLYNLFFS